VVTLNKRLNNSSNDLDLKKHYQLLHCWGYQTIKVTRAATRLTQGQHLVTIRTMGVKFWHGSVFGSGLGFAPRWMKNWHELFKPITKHSDWNRVIFIWKPFYFKVHEKKTRATDILAHRKRHNVLCLLFAENPNKDSKKPVNWTTKKERKADFSNFWICHIVTWKKPWSYRLLTFTRHSLGQILNAPFIMIDKLQ